MNRLLLLVATLAFAALSIVVVAEHGVVGIFLHQFQNLAGWQVLTDLTIALGLFLAWMWHDARSAGRNPWPWLVLTVVAGSFGPLIYLVTTHGRSSRSSSSTNLRQGPTS
jgi:hypothetical protein